MYHTMLFWFTLHGVWLRGLVNCIAMASSCTCAVDAGGEREFFRSLFCLYHFLFRVCVRIVFAFFVNRHFLTCGESSRSFG